MNRTNEALFNRPPRRRATDVNVDSNMRNKLLYPESNNYKIKLPAGPFKNVRSVDVVQMRVPQSESLVHHMQHPALIMDAPQSQGYDGGCDTLCLREGYTIGRHNDSFRFNCQGQSYGIQLPHTLTPMQSYEEENGLVLVKTARPSRLVVNCLVSLIACDPTFVGEYLVIGYREGILELEPTTPRSFPVTCGNGGFIYLPASSNSSELCNYITLLLQQLLELDVRIEFKRNGKFLIWKPDGSCEERDCLIGDDKLEVLQVRLPAGPHSLQEVGGMLQRLLNPPLIVKGENDCLVFADRWKPKQEITLEPGYYNPEQLIERIAELMSGKEVGRFRGNYKDGKFVLASQQPFTLYLNQCPALAYTLGFQPVCLSDSDCYQSKTQILYRQTGCEFACSNLYNVVLDPARSHFTLFRCGSVEAECTLEPKDHNKALVHSKGPHAFHANDVVILHCERGGLAVVLEVLAWNRFVIAFPITETLHCQISAVPKPFTLPCYLDFCNLATVLGFQNLDYWDSQYCYTSDTKCLPTGELYLLLESPQLQSACESQTKLIQHQTGFGEPYRTFMGRLDRYLGGTTFDFSHFGPAQEDLFVGKTVTLDEIEIRLLKPNGKLYDTRKCEHSFVLRIVTEDS